MSSDKRVALFVTCLVDQVMPEVGVATVRLLRRAGYEVHFPEAQSCCGQPFFNSGFRKEARRLARRTVDVLAGEPVVVVPSGSCTTMIRHEYPHLLADEPNYYYRAQRLAAKSYELSEFLAKEAQWQPQAAEDAPSVTYHDSCHMYRILGLGAEPRQLLQQAGCELKEMSEPDRCCGFGGLFSVRMPEVSNAMTAEKRKQGDETEANVLVSADPGCLMQMRGWPEAQGQRVEHLSVVLEEVTR
ncbi:MAG TPA: (Fe-S)-binding protein [Candidatus Sulfomarinibacteraceae bacterium]|nr:(Fe-S)-binding protein [Candidatus Sulfomarinibacteraceae bacterium]